MGKARKKKCSAIAESTGEQCGRWAAAESDVCSHHGAGDPGGRPAVEMTDEQIIEFRTLASLGVTQKWIAEYLQIPLRTIERRVADDPRVKKAWEQGKARGVVFAAKQLHQLIANGDKASIMFFLKCKDPENWNDGYHKFRLEHSGPGGKPIEVQHDHTHDLSKLSEDELGQLKRLHRKALIAEPGRN